MDKLDNYMTKLQKLFSKNNLHDKNNAYRICLIFIVNYTIFIYFKNIQPLKILILSK